MNTTPPLSLTWVDLGTRHEAVFGNVRIEVRSDDEGHLWKAFVVFKENDESFFAGSYDDEDAPMPLPSLLRAQVEAESALRHQAVEALERLGLTAAQVERLGLRRVPAGPTEAGEIDASALYQHIREIVERVGPVKTEGIAHGVRETAGRNLHFALRCDERGAWPCRVSSTVARTLTRPRDGQRVRIRAVPTVFEARGEVQLDVLGLEVVS